MQYNLWFLLLGLLVVPFLPAHSASFFSYFDRFQNITTSYMHTNLEEISNFPQTGTINWLNDFGI